MATRQIGQPKGLRLKQYTDVMANNGQMITGLADQYGRVMEEYLTKDNKWDVRPTGLVIYTNH